MMGARRIHYQTPCAFCGISFLPRTRDNKFCGQLCWLESRRNKPQRMCSVEGCAKKHDMHGFCSGHAARHKLGRPLDAPSHTRFDSKIQTETMRLLRENISAGFC